MSRKRPCERGTMGLRKGDIRGWGCASETEMLGSWMLRSTVYRSTNAEGSVCAVPSRGDWPLCSFHGWLCDGETRGYLGELLYYVLLGILSFLFWYSWYLLLFLESLWGRGGYLMFIHCLGLALLFQRWKFYDIFGMKRIVFVVLSYRVFED